MTFDKHLKNLQEGCQEWLKSYTQLEDKSDYVVAYKQYYSLEQFCAKYFKNKKKDGLQNLEALRQKHHYWQSRFRNSNFLAEMQQIEVIKEAYKELSNLDQKMESIEWEKHDLSSSQLDQQFHQEVQQWKQACQNWLLEQNEQFLTEHKAFELAVQFLGELKQLKESIGQVSLELI